MPSTSVCFNGATDFHRWKCVCSRPSGRNPTGFNGATDFHRWKSFRCLRFRFRLTTLQWGHRFSSVEISMRRSMQADYTRLQWGHRFSSVEMSPAASRCSMLCVLQWGHRFSSVEIPKSLPQKPTTPHSFNGATDFHRWKSQGGVCPDL
mgnify:CR=1 FL=1